MRAAGFAFFLIFLAGIALVNLKNVERRASAGQAGVSLTGRRWHVIPDGNNELLFDTAGGVSGFTGCNRFNGHYRRDGETLRIEIGALTRMACVAATAQAESEYLAMLAGTRQAGIADGKLTLADASGRPLAHLEPLPVAGTAR